MAEYKIGSGYEQNIGTRQSSASPGTLEYFNKVSGTGFENPDMLTQYVNSLNPNAGATSANVFDVVSQGMNPTQVINSAQQSAFDQIKASPTSDPNVLREQANEIIGSNVNDIQTQLKSYQTQLDNLLGNVSSFFQQSETEQKLTKDLNNLDTSFEMGQNAIEDKPIAMQFITGEQASKERRYVQQRNTLVRQLQSETATRQQKLEAAKFLYDATRNRLSDTIQLMQATAPESIANSVDPVTGEMTVIMRNPMTGEITRRSLGQVQTPQRWTENVKLAQEAGVTTPFFSRDGRTIISTNSGKEYSTPEQFFADGGSFDPKFMKANVTMGVQSLAQQQFALEKEQLEWQKNATKFQLGNDAWGNPIVFNPRTGTFTGGDSTGGGSEPYYGLAPKIYDKAAAIVNQFDGEAIVKKYNVVAEGNNFAQNIDPNSKSPADNQAMIYAFAKAMDPDSVVREGEYATVQKYAQSWLENFGFNAARVVSNQEFLTPEAIKNMQSVIQQKYASVATQYSNVFSEYSRRIDATAGQQGKGNEMLTDYSKAYTLQSDPTFNSIFDTVVGGGGFTTNTPLDANKAFNSGGLTFNSEPSAIAPRGVSPASATQSGSIVFASKYPTGYKGGQCGVFARNLLNSYGYDYPKLGDSLKSKASVAAEYGAPQNQWGIGTVLVTSEHEDYGHVPVINGITDKGYRVTESNYKLDGKVSHTRIIPFNSPKIIGGINPTRKSQTA